MDLATFRALSDTQTIPTALYFHENQLTYPQNERQDHAWQYAFINYVSALAADEVYFNSAYHLISFMDALPNMLKHFGDFNELETISVIQAKSSVLSLGLDLRAFDEHKTEKDASGPPIILWNHRWDPDKNPALFFETLYRLLDEGFEFQVALLGENVRQDPVEFDEAYDRLGDRVIRFGFAPDFEDYAEVLWQADYIISTANQDFFGAAVVEAVHCGCVPLLPYRLNYPSLIPTAYHEACLYSANDLYSLLRQHLQGQIQVDRAVLREHIAQYDWQEMAPQYDESFTRLVRAHQAGSGS